MNSHTASPQNLQSSFQQVWETAKKFEGWLTDDQAWRLWQRASELSDDAQIVEIGSFRGRSAAVLASAAPPSAKLVAIDPHAGNDRGPQEIHGSQTTGDLDNQAFNTNLANAQVKDKVRHVRLASQIAHSEVSGEIDLLYIDGAHRFSPAFIDITTWGVRVKQGGTLLIHDSFSSLGVTSAIAVSLLLSRRFTYQGRSGSLAEYRCEPTQGSKYIENVGKQLAQLPYFLRNLVIKAALVAGAKPVARLMGHKDGPWPF